MIAMRFRVGQQSSVMRFSALISIFVFSFACGMDSGHPPPDQIRLDSTASGRVVVSNPDLGVYAAEGGLQLVEDMRVGSGPADDDSLAFGNVAALAVGGDGAVYAADDRRGEVLVFDSAGVLMRRMGRRGGGPGEFRYVSMSVSWQAPNRLWVADGPLLNVVDESGLPVATAIGLGQLAGVPKTDAATFAYVRQSRAHDTATFPATNGTYVLIKYGISTEGDVAVVDSLPLGSWTRTSRVRNQRGGEGAIVMIMEALPMEPDLVWAMGPSGNAWIAATSEHVMHEVVFTGDTVRSVELRRAPVPLRGAERDSLADASGFGAGELPALRPAMDRLDVARDGLMWVRNRLPDGSFAWDVFDACGRYLDNVAPGMRLDGRPVAVGEGGRLFGVVKDDLDIEYVVRMSLRTASGDRVEAFPC